MFHGDAGSGAVHPAGMASLRSGFHFARFDDLSIFTMAEPSPWPKVLFDKHLLSPPHAFPGGKNGSPVRRSDVSGQVGCRFTLAQTITVTALGRFSSAENATRRHTLQVLHAETRVPCDRPSLMYDVQILVLSYFYGDFPQFEGFMCKTYYYVRVCLAETKYSKVLTVIRGLLEQCGVGAG